MNDNISIPPDVLNSLPPKWQQWFNTLVSFLFLAKIIWSILKGYQLGDRMIGLARWWNAFKTAMDGTNTPKEITQKIEKIERNVAGNTEDIEKNADDIANK